MAASQIAGSWSRRVSELTPTVYLPIESEARELDARLLLAQRLVPYGIRVVIGQQWLMRVNYGHYPRGVVLFKGLNRVQVQNMLVLGRRGYVPMALDEEALGLADETYMSRDIHPSLGACCEVVFAQGAHHAEVIRAHGRVAANRIHVVGNARLDLLAPRYRPMHQREADSARERYGRYVLFNTNVGFVHSSWSSLAEHEEVLKRTGWLDPNDPSSYELHRRDVVWDQLNHDVTTRTVRGLAARRPDRRIIVRPHPAERPDAWQDAFGDLPNVSVVREGSHIAMIMAADLVLHTGCTTGLEAMVLGRPTLSIRHEDKSFDQWRCFVSNHLNPVAVGAEEAVRLASGALDGVLDLDAIEADRRQEAYSRFVSGAGDGSAFEAIAEIINDRFLLAGVEIGEGEWRPTDAAAALRHVKRTDYQARRVSMDQEAFNRRYAMIAGLAGRTKAIRIREIGESLFLLQKRF